MARYLNDLDANSTLDNADIALIEQSGVDKKVTLNDIKDFVLESVFPIGTMYLQLPGKSEPSALSYPGTWTNVSSSFAGDFFRVEGGDAETFEAGQQTDTLQGHEHTVPSNNNVGGDASWLLKQTSNVTTGTTTTTIRSKDPYGTVRYSIETRPVNQTIRIWERTA